QWCTPKMPCGRQFWTACTQSPPTKSLGGFESCSPEILIRGRLCRFFRNRSKVQDERADPVYLNDRVALNAPVVPHAIWNTGKCACFQFGAARFRVFFPIGEYERSLQDGEVFVRRMPVRWNLFTIRRLQAEYERN